MMKKEIRQSLKVDMGYFLKVYYGFTNEELIDKLSKLSHKDLKEIISLYEMKMPRISFEKVTREMIARGAIILVTDGFGCPAPYINPNILLEDEYATTLGEQFVSCVCEKEKRK